MYDAAIIGTGPAGLSAAIVLKLHNKEIIWFGSGQYSDKVGKAEKIANYPGMGLITGTELNARFAAHAAQMELDIIENMVTSVMAADDHFMLLAESEIYTTKTVLLATGAATAKGFPGETALLGRGVSYCATCDGFLVKGKTIAVYCGAKRYEHEVSYLAGLAEKVYLHTQYKDSEIDLPNVECLKKPIKQVMGENRVSGVGLADDTLINVDALFCLRDAIAPATLLPGLEADDTKIITNRKMETNLPGCFAAGDCAGRPYQIAKATGEGNTAAHSIVEYLS